MANIKLNVTDFFQVIFVFGAGDHYYFFHLKLIGVCTHHGFVFTVVLLSVGFDSSFLRISSCSSKLF